MGQRRRDAASRNYGSSKLRDLNEGRKRAAALRPLRASDASGEPFVGKARITTLEELVKGSAKVDELCGDADSHLLIPDEMNAGYFTRKAIYDIPEAAVGRLYICDVHEGRVALHADTLISWQ